MQIHTILEMVRNMFHAQKINKSFWAKKWLMYFYKQNHFPIRALFPSRLKKRGGKKCLALYTCVCLGVSPMQYLQIHKGVSLMQMTQNI